MGKYVKKDDRPVYEAIQANWQSSSNVIKRGDWIIKEPDGRVSYGSDEWFHKNFAPLDNG